MNTTSVGTRVINVIPGSGGNPVSVTTNASTYGELKNDLDRSGVNYQNSSVIEGINQTELVSNDSRLPEGNFSLFILGKQKVKSGISNDLEYTDYLEDIDWDIEDQDDVKTALDIIETLTDNLNSYANSLSQAAQTPKTQDQLIWEKLNRELNGGN